MQPIVPNLNYMLGGSLPLCFSPMMPSAGLTLSSNSLPPYFLSPPIPSLLSPSLGSFPEPSASLSYSNPSANVPYAPTSQAMPILNTRAAKTGSSLSEHGMHKHTTSKNLSESHSNSSLFSYGDPQRTELLCAGPSQNKQKTQETSKVSRKSVRYPVKETRFPNVTALPSNEQDSFHETLSGEAKQDFQHELTNEKPGFPTQLYSYMTLDPIKTTSPSMAEPSMLSNGSLFPFVFFNNFVPSCFLNGAELSSPIVQENKNFKQCVAQEIPANNDKNAAPFSLYTQQTCCDVLTFASTPDVLSNKNVKDVCNVQGKQNALYGEQENKMEINVKSHNIKSEFQQGRDHISPYKIKRQKDRNLNKLDDTTSGSINSLYCKGNQKKERSHLFTLKRKRSNGSSRRTSSTFISSEATREMKAFFLEDKLGIPDKEGVDEAFLKHECCDGQAFATKIATSEIQQAQKGPEKDRVMCYVWRSDVLLTDEHLFSNSGSEVQESLIKGCDKSIINEKSVKDNKLCSVDFYSEPKLTKVPPNWKLLNKDIIVNSDIGTNFKQTYHRDQTVKNFPNTPTTLPANADPIIEDSHVLFPCATPCRHLDMHPSFDFLFSTTLQHIVEDTILT